jgi:hypothetical protein
MDKIPLWKWKEKDNQSNFIVKASRIDEVGAEIKVNEYKLVEFDWDSCCKTKTKVWLARTRSKQDHHYKTLAVLQIFFSPRKHNSYLDFMTNNL